MQDLEKLKIVLNMEIIDLKKTLPNNGSNGYRQLKDIQYAIVHHDAVMVLGEYNAIERYVNQASYHVRNPNKFGKRFAYTYKIDVKGNVYLCSPLEQMCYHAGNFRYNKNSIGICLDGSFDKQSPSDAQLEALEKLLDYLCTQRPDIPKLVKKTVKYHGEVRLFATVCPGKPIKDFVIKYRS